MMGYKDLKKKKHCSKKINMQKRIKRELKYNKEIMMTKKITCHKGQYDNKNPIFLFYNSFVPYCTLSITFSAL